MLGRTAVVSGLGLMVLLLFGCGGGGDNYFSGQRGAAGGTTSLDIAGTYLVDPDTFGFNMLTIYQNGSNLTATDNGGGSWSGTLSNVTIEEKAGAGGMTVITWRGDVTLTGKNAVGDNLSLTGVVEISSSATGGIPVITAQYQNLSIGLTGQLLLIQGSPIPGIVPGAGGGGGTGRENQ